jgi:hypothetical protein
VVAITKLSKEHFADPFAKSEAVLYRRLFEHSLSLGLRGASGNQQDQRKTNLVT